MQYNIYNKLNVFFMSNNKDAQGYNIYQTYTNSSFLNLNSEQLQLIK